MLVSASLAGTKSSVGVIGVRGDIAMHCWGWGGATVLFCACGAHVAQAVGCVQIVLIWF